MAYKLIRSMQDRGDFHSIPRTPEKFPAPPPRTGKVPLPHRAPRTRADPFTKEITRWRPEEKWLFW